MNTKQIEKILIEGGIETNEAKIETKMLIKHFLGFSDINVALNNEFEEREELLQAAILRAQKRIPIQHIIGSANFMGEDFIINENVLIPRDETEILARKAIDIINKNKFRKILDIGTGSGCIACMIAKHTSAQVVGIDISTDALQIALENSSKLGLYNKAIFRKSDIFSNMKINEKFDMIISNPPYIPKNEKNKLQIEVGFEPDLALFAQDEKGIEFYERIITQASDFLNKNGYLMLEIGINQSETVKKIMEKQGFKNIEIEKDLAYIERIIYGNYE